MASHSRLKFALAVLPLCAALFLPACATAPGGTASPNSTPTGTTPTGTANTPSAPAASTRWPVKTASHVDLWLHSFAVLSVDNLPIPLYKRGYRDSITIVKNRSNVLSNLDANRETLSKRLVSNPALVQAQFLALQFASFAELKRATEVFLQFEGDAQRAPDQNTGLLIRQLAASFPTAGDREWLRLFMAGVVDEQARFYANEYARVLQDRSTVIAAVDSLWQKVYRAKFERFLTNTSQRMGEMYLSLPLGAEGRAAAGPTGQTAIAVPFPARRADAVQSLFVFAHEVTGNLVGTVVGDNTTPAQQRDGSAGSFVAFGQVLGGLLLLQKIAPELAEPYARYYLAQGGKAVPALNAAAALRSAFPLPQAIADALARQIDIVLAGI